MRSLALVLVVATAAGCANNVNGKSHSGSDGSWKHPKELTLTDGQVIDHDIVTYPGGDRADWKVIEIPKDEKGSVNLKLSWKTPRPGLQLAFDAYDAYGKNLIKSKASARRHRGASAGVRQKEETIGEAKGRILIRVYAVNRGDAGDYKLEINYTPDPKPVDVDPSKITINDPPRLPDLPAVVAPCDPFDTKTPSCHNVCPDPPTLAPPHWKPCEPAPGTCNKDNPDPSNDACIGVGTVPCPPPEKWEPKYRKNCPEPTVCPSTPNLALRACKPKPIQGHILTVQISGSGTVVTVAAVGVGKDYRVSVLRGQTGQPLSGGTGQIVRIDGRKVICQLSMTPDQLADNKEVLFSPP
jgi:hypothetical protein